MVELPPELPPPIEPLPEPGVLVVPEVLPDVPAPEPVELPLPLMPEEPEVVPPDAPLELEPDLLKWASHSWREIWPSLFVSTDEKLGELALLLEDPLAAGLLDEPPDDMPEEPPELLPEAAGEDDEPDAPDEPEALEESDDPLEVLPDADGEEAAGADEDGLLDDEEEDCATANVESANRTAAVVTLRALGIDESPCSGG